MVSLTIFGEEVDDCVSLTVPVQVCQLRAAVHCHVMDPKPSLTIAGGVQNSTLKGEWSKKKKEEKDTDKMVSTVEVIKC